MSAFLVDFTSLCIAVRLSKQNLLSALPSACPTAISNLPKYYRLTPCIPGTPPTVHLQEIVRVLQLGGRLALGFSSRDFMQHLSFTQHGFSLYEPEEMADQLQQYRLEVVNVQHRKNLGKVESYPDFKETLSP